MTYNYNNIYEKAAKLVKEDKVKKCTDQFYVVQGKTEDYNVRVRGGKFSCDCRFASVQGIPNGDLCGHEIAVIYIKIQNELNNLK